MKFSKILMFVLAVSIAGITTAQKQGGKKKERSPEEIARREAAKAKKAELSEKRKHLKEGRDAVLGEHKGAMKDMSKEERKAYIKDHPDLKEKLEAYKAETKEERKEFKEERAEFREERAKQVTENLERRKEKVQDFEQRATSAEEKLAKTKARIAAQKEAGEITEEQYNEKMEKVAKIEERVKKYEEHVNRVNENIAKSEKRLEKLSKDKGSKEEDAEIGE